MIMVLWLRKQKFRKVQSLGHSRAAGMDDGRLVGWVSERKYPQRNTPDVLLCQSPCCEYSPKADFKLPAV